MEAIINKWTIVIDSMEKAPWIFEGLTQRRRGRDIPIVVPTITVRLASGDYSILGLEDQIAVERKSPKDLISTIASFRNRFIRELERLNDMDFAAVIIEAEWAKTLNFCESSTRYNPRSLDSSILAWMQRYPGVHWIWRPGRFAAAKTAWKIFDRYVKDHNNEYSTKAAT